MVTSSPECPIYVPGYLVHQPHRRDSEGGTYHIVDGAEAVTSERKIIRYILCYLPATRCCELTLCTHAIFAYIKRKLWERKMPSKLVVGHTFLG
jgi:hypothetical protein